MHESAPPLVILTADQLREIVLSAVRAALAEFKPVAEVNDVMTYGEAAEWSGFSVSTLAREAKAGRLRLTRVGRAARVDRASLCEWLESQRT
jgi:excisionase family DNA binding protein